MGLGKYFISNRPREISGSVTADKYTYQQEWALYKIIELFEQDKNFALIMEYHEDVVIFDNSTNPKHVDMFQIKTNEKKSETYITPAVLMRQEKDKTKKPPKVSQSFLEKLFYNFSLFYNYDKNIYFVSNKPFKFEGSNIDSDIKNPIFLEELSTEDFNNLKSQICAVCGQVSCKQECKDCVAVDKSSLNVQTSYEQLFVKLQNLISNYADVTYSDHKAIYNTLMSQIKTINDSREKYFCNDFDILIQKYSITKDRLMDFLNKISLEQSFSSKWNEIHASLLNEHYKFNEIKKIKSACQEYILDTFKDFDGELKILNDLIDVEIKSSKYQTLNETIESILGIIKRSEVYDPLIHQDDFYRGAIIMRWFNE